MTEPVTTLYNSLKAIFLHIDNHEKAFLARFGLTLPRFFVLLHVHNHPRINYIELSDLLLCTKSNTTRIAQGLLADGLLERNVHPDDRRAYQLSLTPQGQSLLDEVLPKYEALVAGLMGSFSETEIKRYTRFAKHIENTLAPNQVNARYRGLPGNTEYGKIS